MKNCLGFSLVSKLLSHFLFTAIAFASITAFAQQQGQPMDRTAAWKSVEDAIARGLPQTAIEKLQPIIDASIAEKAYDEAIKAIGMKIMNEGNIQGNRPEEKIVRMREAISASPVEMKPVMEAVLANWFWDYFQQNRWQFLQRTQMENATESKSSTDFTTWSLPQILREIDSQFDRALENRETLQSTSTDKYRKLLDQGNAPATFRPTMFDVIAHNALEFYSAGEQGAAKVQDAFDLNADGPVFGSRDDFIAWKPTTTDTDSLLLRAVELYQELIQFHMKDIDPSALLDADLLRLEFANNHATGDEKNERYKNALKQFEQANAKHAISTRALHSLAAQIHSEGAHAEAHKIAKEGLNRFPESVGSNRCYNLIQEIEAPSATVSTERVWSDPWPTIDVRYRNTSKVYLRLVRFDFDSFIRRENWSPGYFDFNDRRSILQQTPIKSWSIDLPKTDDFQERVEKVSVPKDIPLGSYVLIASSDPQFLDKEQQLSLNEIWVSKLALVMRTDQLNGYIEGFVVDSKSGEPIVGAQVAGWQRGDRNQIVVVDPVKSDRNGMFRFPASTRRGLFLLASHQGDKLSSANSLDLYVGNFEQPPARQTQFFTDRAIYRPGQTIQYKGICIQFDHEKDTYGVLVDHAVSILFSDANGKEIERQQHKTNAFGSFSGSVTAPRDRLMGAMYLRVEGNPPGQTTIRVEEYKRPKFRVELASPKVAAKLGDTVTAPGKATAYTGVPINDAKVRWRVVREVRYPIWWAWRCWWAPPQPGESQEIAHGESTTAADGSFEVTFVAKPDKSVSIESEPTFEYKVYADVTDTTGETRSGDHVIKLGYTTLTASMTAASWLTTQSPTAISVLTTTLDGDGQAATGTVRVYALREPDRIVRPNLANENQPWNRFSGMSGSDNKADSASGITSGLTSDPNSWPLGEVVAEQAFTTDGAGKASKEFALKAGLYRAVLETRDSFGKEVKAILPLHILNLEANKPEVKLAEFLAIKSDVVEPGKSFEALWGSGYESARAYIEVQHRGKLLQSYWTDSKQTQKRISQEVTEAMRGGFHVRVTMVRENRSFTRSHFIDVPWSNKELSIKWERFVSKLGPGQKETWTAIVTGADAKRVATEMVATLYDASLDAFTKHDWLRSFGVFRREQTSVYSQFANTSRQFYVPFLAWRPALLDGSLTYPRLPESLISSRYGNRRFGGRAMRGMRMESFGVMPAAPATAMSAMAADDFRAVGGGMVAEGEMFAKSADKQSGGNGQGNDVPSGGKEIDLSNVTARKNLNETAFFFPQLVAGEDGSVRIEFTMPEALTEWKFFGFAHDSQLRSGLLSDTAVTSKDLMIQPNPPRFLREGDIVEFTVKVSNRSATRQSGSVRLNLSDARTLASVDTQLGNTSAEKSFDIAAGDSQSYAWRLSVPDAIGFLTYKAVGSTGRISDGEEGFLPVLSRRILVTESLPLPIRGKQTKEFDFVKLGQSADSKTLQHQSLTVQMVSNPSWYAVMALPYLMEFPHECSEQVFNRLYSNALAQHIVTSDPKIERIFAQWRGTPALDSPLEKNEDLKSVLLEETPWLRQAQDESQSRREVGVLFDQNRLNSELQRALAKLTEAQREDGQWPWFPGGPKNEFITLYITTGFGRLRHLGVNIDASVAIRSLERLDAWVMEMYERIKPEDREKNHLSTTIALYLYGRSFFLDDMAILPEHRVAVDYWLGQARSNWLSLGSRQSEAHLAIALKRFGDLKAAQGIMASLKERSVTSEEMGMHWRDLENAWWWYHAPIESQAMMIEAFDEVMNDAESVESCKVWLLKQKQTQNWRTTKATADAVYAMLLRGTNMLASDELVQVSLGGKLIVPEAVEAGTGFTETRFTRGEITPEQSKITVTKVDQGVAWGSVHWQYLEDISKVTPHDGTPLKLTKELYLKKNTPKGPALEKVNQAIAVGDELVVRVVLRSDRDMEFIHLKDHRGSGTEPVNVLSQYKYQDGLAYYESTRDTASHFFIDYLPKGTYVFEYSTRVQLRGEYQTGMAAIECMYAPEFNSHSESLPIQVE